MKPSWMRWKPSGLNLIRRGGGDRDVTFRFRESNPKGGVKLKFGANRKGRDHPRASARRNPKEQSKSRTSKRKAFSNAGQSDGNQYRKLHWTF